MEATRNGARRAASRTLLGDDRGECVIGRVFVIAALVLVLCGLGAHVVSDFEHDLQAHELRIKGCFFPGPVAF